MITDMVRLGKSLAPLTRLISVLLLIATLACRQESPLPEPSSSVTATEANQQFESSNIPVPTPTPEVGAQALTDDWPAFTMIYEIKGPTLWANGQIVHSSTEIHRFDFESKSEWVDTVIDAPEISTDYGMVSRLGSYQQLQGHQLTEFDANDGSLMQTSVDEGEVETITSLFPSESATIQVSTMVCWGSGATGFSLYRSSLRYNTFPARMPSRSACLFCSAAPR